MHTATFSAVSETFSAPLLASLRAFVLSEGRDVSKGGGGGGGPISVGLLTVGSGRYGAFSRVNTMSAEKYLLRGVAEMHYFIFTDKVQMALSY